VGAPVQFVSEFVNWAIRWVGEHIRDEINSRVPDSVALTTSPGRQVDRVVHFGSPHLWITWGHMLSKSNKFVVSFFHGRPEDGEDYARHIEQFLATVLRLSMVVTGASLVERRLLDWGIPREKLIRIPIGVDTTQFVPPNSYQRSAARQKFGIPIDTILVGSFQKDGNGWGNGNIPKLVKGPDIFVAAVTQLKRMGMPVMAMLTGPARGYVKDKLKNAGIPYTHVYPAKQIELVDCYHALDLYLVTSREEGGPMGLLESMATGVPVVSTRVGMGPDFIEDGVSGALVDIGDADAVAEASRAILNCGNRTSLTARARASVLDADWNIVGSDHWNKVYRPLLEVLAK